LRIVGVSQPLSELGAAAVAVPDLSANHNQVQIDFFGNQLRLGEALRYQYKLEGTRRIGARLPRNVASITRISRPAPIASWCAPSHETAQPARRLPASTSRSCRHYKGVVLYDSRIVMVSVVLALRVIVISESRRCAKHKKRCKKAAKSDSGSLTCAHGASLRPHDDIGSSLTPDFPFE